MLKYEEIHFHFVSRSLADVMGKQIGQRVCAHSFLNAVTIALPLPLPPPLPPLLPPPPLAFYRRRNSRRGKSPRPSGHQSQLCFGHDRYTQVRFHWTWTTLGEFGLRLLCVLQLGEIFTVSCEEENDKCEAHFQRHPSWPEVLQVAAAGQLPEWATNLTSVSSTHSIRYYILTGFFFFFFCNLMGYDVLGGQWPPHSVSWPFGHLPSCGGSGVCWYFLAKKLAEDKANQLLHMQTRRTPRWRYFSAFLNDAWRRKIANGEKKSKKIIIIVFSAF